MHFKVNEDAVFGSTCRVQRRCLVVWRATVSLEHSGSPALLWGVGGGGGGGGAPVCIASRTWLYW